MNPASLSSLSQKTVTSLQGTPYSNASPMKSQRVPHLPPQPSYVKPYQQQQQSNQYTVQVTPPRTSQPHHMTTPSTAQTQFSNNALGQSQASVPSRFNIALDQVCLLGHEMDQMRKNFEEVQGELQQWKEKCALIKTIAQTPPPGTNYSPTRTNKLHNDVHNSFQNYQAEINQINQIIEVVNGDLLTSVDRIKQLEKRVGEMNKLELEMLQAKKQALELDSKNRFQTMELNDLKSKMDSRNNQTDDVFKLVQTIPNLKESVQVLEMENKKLISIIQQKDDQLEKQDMKHIQLTKMYQDNLEKTNQVSQQLREALSENEEINAEVERTHNIADSVNTMNIQNSVYSNNHSNSGNRGKAFLNPDGSLRDSTNSKRSQTSGTQSRNLRNNQRLNDVQNTILEQQGSLEALHKIIQEQDNRIINGDNERTIMAKQIEETLNDMENLRNAGERDRQENDDNLRRAQQEFADQISGSVIPLQQENEQMQREIQQMQHELSNLKHSLQCLENDKAALQDQLSLERQQAFNTQQKIINEYQQKCDAMSDALIKKDKDLDSEILKNKELFDDNKLMAEEMRNLKQKSAELDVWKNKYRDLKKETRGLRQQFDEYKRNFIREIQNRFALNCDQFEQCLQDIDDRYDSTQSQQNDHFRPVPVETNPRSQYVSSQAPHLQEVHSRQGSPSQERLRQMKATPGKSSVVSSSLIIPKNNPPEQRMSTQQMANVAMQLTGGQQTTTPPSQVINSQQPQYNNTQYQQQQYHQPQPFIEQRSSQSNGYASGSGLGNSIRQSMTANQDQGKYSKELMQTNNELDNKLEELVVLKAKYEDALNRVHQNINSATPKKVVQY